TFINVFDFESPKSLADYLNVVSVNETLYRHYRQWQKNYSIVSTKFEPDNCLFLSLITKSMKEGIKEDSTIFKLNDRSICLDPETIKTQFNIH
ncbi:hypothetical protein HZS_7699, partial [Henneguya salminicola]